MLLPPEPPQAWWLGTLQLGLISGMLYGLLSFIRNAYFPKVKL